MAASRVASRLSSRIKPVAFKLNTKSLSPQPSLLTSNCSPSQLSISTRRLSRLPVELSSVGSMMPSYSALASARLVSSLSSESKSWALVPQGISMPL